MENNSALMNSEEAKYVHTSAYQVPASEVNRIELRCTSEGIAIEEAQGSSIEVFLENRHGRDQEKRVSIQRTNGLMKIMGPTIRDDGSRQPSMQWVRVCLRIPCSYGGSLCIKSNSGNVRSSGVCCSEYVCEVKSGRLQMEQISTGRTLEVGAHSGSVEIQDVTAGDVRIRTLSGTVSCDGIVCERLETQTQSGRQRLMVHAADAVKLAASSGVVEFEGSAARLSVRTKSGQQRLVVDTAAYVDLEASSGSIRLAVPEAQKLEEIRAHTKSAPVHLLLPPGVTPVVDFDSLSGKRAFCRDDFVLDGRPVSINAKTSSGKLTIAPI